MVLRLLENPFVTQNIESTHFYSCPQVKLTPRQKKITHFPQTTFFEYLFLPAEKGEGTETMEWKK